MSTAKTLRAGRIRVRVVVDDDFDRTCADWDPSIRAENAAGLESGDLEAYGLILEELHCDRPASDRTACRHDENLGARWGIVVPGDHWTGMYTLDGLADAGETYLARVALDILTEAAEVELAEQDTAARERLEAMAD